MTVTPGTVTLEPAGVRRPIASAYTALAIIENTGTVLARLVTEPGDALDGLTIAPGATLEVEPLGRTVYAVADTATTLAVTRYTVEALRADAAAEFRVPVEFIRGRTKAEIGEYIVAFLGHEAVPDTAA